MDSVALPADPDEANILFRLDKLREASGTCNLQFSGGEPTLRDDLPRLIQAARRKGFALIQVNSNGLRLAREAGYAQSLAEAGLDSVYLQFDGPDDEAFRALRGRELLADKLAAVRACAGAGLGVVLVATLVRGVNLHRLGDLLRLALAQGTALRGLHLQPAASFGRHPWPGGPEQGLGQVRVTLPEVMRALAEQAPELVSVTDFHPPGCEHALCSFSTLYKRLPGGGLAPARASDSCCAPPSPASQPLLAAEGARVAKAFTALHWAGKTGPAPHQPGLQRPDQGTPVNRGRDAPVPGQDRSPPMDDFDRFLARAGLEQRFTLSCMAFQDADSVDLDRIQGCCIHVVAPDGCLIPFCMYNLTARDGRSLYRSRYAG